MMLLKIVITAVVARQKGTTQDDASKDCDDSSSC